MRRFLLYSLLAIGALVFIYPFVWMVAATFKPEAEVTNFNLFSNSFSFDNYLFVFRKIPVTRSFFNSLFVSVIVTASVIFFGSVTGYALARLRFAGRSLVVNIALLTMMIPAQLTLIPLYTLVVRFGWINSFAALIVPAMMSSYAALLFRNFFMQIPQSLVEAARLDGCSDLRILFSIIFPLSKPIIWTVALLTFMGIWNDVLWSLMVIRDETKMTMPLVVTLFAVGGGAEARLGAQLAAAALLAVPVIVAYVFLQRHLIESLAASGMKN
ncbi:MAG: carbohydrate ABC transporter permease [Pyrinomonadaceae bacterium MAG19_C2-C3]|nr:carbohydrate ABC transporter permease [Pyrinomonadaceae bacterium MAG19_C2-C3]